MTKKIASIDIGTTKICTIIAEIKPLKNINENLENENHQKKLLEKINILAVGVTASKGLKSGKVDNVITLSKQINKSIKKAEKMADINFSNIKKVYTGVSNAKIKIDNSIGLVEINKEVVLKDIQRAIKLARLGKKSLDYEIIHSITDKYFIDNDLVTYPLNMKGNLLKTKCKIINISKNQLVNFKRVLNNNNIENKEIVLQILANKEAILTNNELNLGVMLIDIGGGTTDIGIFKKGKIQYVDILDIGGEDFTKTIAKNLKTTIYEAEKIKRNFSKIENLDKNIKIKSANGKDNLIINSKKIIKVVDEEIDKLVNKIIKSLEKSDMYLNDLTNIVLTGGGSNVINLDIQLQKHFNTPTRVIKPNQEIIEVLDNFVNKKYCNIKKNQSAFSTVIGLLYLAIKDVNSKEKNEVKNNKKQILKNNFKKNTKTKIKKENNLLIDLLNDLKNNCKSFYEILSKGFF